MAIPIPGTRIPAESSPEERDWLGLTFASISEAVITINSAGNILLHNPMAESLTGWTQAVARDQPLIGVFKIISGINRQTAENPTIRTLRDGFTTGLPPRTLLLNKDATEHPIDGSSAPIRDTGGDIIGAVLTFRDITEPRRVETERNLEEVAWRKSEVQYRRLFESARDGILILDEKSGKIIDANPFMCELLGFDYAHFIGRELWEIGLFRDIAANQAVFQELQLKGYIRYDHLPLETKDGRKVEVEFVSNIYEADGQVVIQCNIRDCSERVRLEQEVRASLGEKEVLLKEVHHRVKNNLQVISSLLYLQSQQTSDPESANMFRESQNRVRSMALIHERLYRSGDLAQVDFTGYIKSLAAHLFSSHRIASNLIQLVVDATEVRLPIDAAIPCGLLLNELISNCLKHAFGKGEPGEIRVGLRIINESNVLLSVSDTGIGLPAEIDPQAGDSFGMQLVTDLVEQLHGVLEIDRNSGTTMRIIFPTTGATSLRSKVQP